MKYNLLLYFRLAIFTLIVPSTLLVSNASHDQTLEQHIDKLCNVLTEKRLQLSSTQDGTSNKYKGLIQNKAFKDEFPLLFRELSKVAQKESDEPYTIDTLKETFKKKLLSDLSTIQNSHFLTNYSFLIFIEFYTGNMDPLEFLNVITYTQNKDWKYFKDDYISTLSDDNLNNEDFLKNRTSLSSFKQSLNKYPPYVFKRTLRFQLEKGTSYNGPLPIKKLFIENKPHLYSFRLIAENIIQEKNFSLTTFLNRIAKLNSKNNDPPVRNLGLKTAGIASFTSIVFLLTFSKRSPKKKVLKVFTPSQKRKKLANK